MRTLFAVLGLTCAFAIAESGTTEPLKVYGKTSGDGTPFWEHKGMKSSPATPGSAAGRLQVKVKNGDIVRFANVTGKHGVLFENGGPELEAGVWSVAEGSGKLEKPSEIDKPFDPEKVRWTRPKGMEKIIDIKIAKLKPGADNGILFGCNPHSLDEGEKREMLGVIVLDEGKDK
jgi:hypothetical protein